MHEFTVILYAGGINRLTNDLSYPKCLLPIGNRPLIWYSLQLIQSNSSLNNCPLFILTSSQCRQMLDEYLSTLNLNYELITSRQHHESTNTTKDDHHHENFGTLDILRLCYSRIRTESICLITCDLFGKIDLNPFINRFRVRDAALIMLLLHTSKDSIIQPGQKTKYTPETEFYIIDDKSETMTSIRLKADLDDDLPIKQNILAKYPRTIIRTDLIDGHLYLIKKSCLDVAIRSIYSSFRKEFLPKMIRQYAINQPLENLLQTSNTVIRTKETDFDDITKIFQRYDCINEQIKGGCYYFIDQTQLFRIKHIHSYLEANRQASSLISLYTKEDVTFKDRLEQIQITSDCIIADGIDLGKKTNIKRTIIGKHCRIEDKCKIIDCVILDHVHIKEGVTLQKSILCSRSIIGSKCEIQNSIICANQQVDPNRKLNGETISSISNESTTYMDYDDDDEQ